MCSLRHARYIAIAIQFFIQYTGKNSYLTIKVVTITTKISGNYMKLVQKNIAIINYIE